MGTDLQVNFLSLSLNSLKWFGALEVFSFSSRHLFFFLVYFSTLFIPLSPPDALPPPPPSPAWISENRRRDRNRRAGNELLAYAESDYLTATEEGSLHFCLYTCGQPKMFRHPGSSRVEGKGYGLAVE